LAFYKTTQLKYLVMQHFQTKKNSLLIAAVIICIGVSCNKDKFPLLFDLAISNRLVINVANIQVVDMNYKPFSQGDIIVEQIADGKTKVYALEGFDTLKYSNGFINIGVPPRDTPTVSKPLNFSIRIRHKNADYLPEVVNFTIASNQIQDKIVKLLNLNNLAGGIKADRKGIPIASCKTAQEIILSNTFGNGQKTTVTIPTGTSFFDKNGEPMCGAVKGILISFDTDSITALKAFPGGLVYKNATDASGRIDFKSGIFTTYGFFWLDLTVDDNPVYSFSKSMVSVDKTNGVNRTLEINGTTQPHVLNDGDWIPIWNTTDGSVWKADTLAQISNNKTTFNITTSGWKNWADPSCLNIYNWFDSKFRFGQNVPFAGCQSCEPKIKMQVASEVNSRYYTEISLTSNPKMIVANPMMEYKNGNSINLIDYLGEVDRNVKITFNVYDIEPWRGGKPLNPVPIQRLACALDLLDLRSIRFPQYAEIKTDFSMICANSSGTEITLSPSVTLYAKEIIGNNQSDTWSYVGTIRNGKGVTKDILQGGKKYLFGVFPNSSFSFTTKDVDITENINGNIVSITDGGITLPTVMNNSIPILLRFKKDLWQLDATVVLQNTGDNSYSLSMNWRPSARTCEGYLRHF
jgi:hypothetical protein